MRLCDGHTMKRLWTVAVILYIGFIFHNSLTPALESSRQSSGVLAVVLAAADNIGIEGAWITEHFIRKTAHFAEYTLLGLLLSVAVRQYAAPLPTELLVKGWLGTMIPLADETIQLFVEGRSGQISDVWLDMGGVLAGVLTAGLAECLLKVRAGRKRDGKAECGDASGI